VNRRRLSPRLRIQFLALLILLGMGALGLRLWWIQVAHGAEWTAQIRGSSQATVRLPSVRGEIRDRNGLALVQNRASYEVDFYLPEMVKGYRERFGQPPLREHRAIINGMPKDVKEPDIIKIVNSGVVPRLDDLDLARDYNAAQLRRHYRNDTEVPYSYIKDIDFPTMAKFSEHDVGLPGVDIAVKPVRSYVYGALAAHILGYVGAPDEVNKEEARKYTFYQGDVEGKSNIEKSMDEYLRGKPGVRYLRRNAKGVIDGVIREVPPQQGADVYLTIDARIQSIAEEALRAVGRGAAVVMDPNTGAVLAMASVPSFDPNKFIPSIKAKDWQALRKDEADPLVDRAISAFPPGSTFKLVTALAGVEKGLAKAKFTCYGGVTYGDHYFHCWIGWKGGQHGTLTLTDAIKVSCDAYFYQYGNAAGIAAIDQIGKMMGLGEESGIPLTSEQAGVLPGPEWLQVHHPRERWSQAYTANVSIGQGYVLVTPLQLAVAYCTIANGGVCYYPRLVEKVLNQDGTPLLNDHGKVAVPDKPRVRSDLRNDFTSDEIELVRKGLWEVVNGDGGTGGVARLKDTVVAGKTGTAQASDRGREGTVAWFACFAPFDHPKYVVVAMVQAGEKGGHGGSVAGPIATRILQRTLAMDEGKFDMPVAWLAPAHKANPFQSIKAVDYGSGGNLSTDDENADNAQNADAQMAGAGGAPDVEPEADAQGRVSKRTHVARAIPVATPRPRGFFERLFGIRHQPQPTPTPRRRNSR
jgi:penicillin-binding protein 2